MSCLEVIGPQINEIQLYIDQNCPSLRSRVKTFSLNLKKFSGCTVSVHVALLLYQLKMNIENFISVQGFNLKMITGEGQTQSSFIVKLLYYCYTRSGHSGIGTKLVRISFEFTQDLADHSRSRFSYPVPNGTFESDPVLGINFRTVWFHGGTVHV